MSTSLFYLRYIRTAVLTDLSIPQTQTVSVTYPPAHMYWKVSGDVQGTGTVMISHVLSNKVSGRFSTNGGGDYYDTNASVSFIPDGPARGKIKASLRFAQLP